MKERICVLAYSGGLDTSAIVPWLHEKGWSVHALLVNVGQDEDFEVARRRAFELGAAGVHVHDAREEMLAEACAPATALAAVYEGRYRLGTALARPFIAAAQVSLARALGASAVAHGATGKGNDQVRFEFAYRTLAPELETIAPWKEWSFTGRKDLIDYLASRGHAMDFPEQKTYSLDENLWHLSIEGGELEDPGAVLDVPDLLQRIAGRFYADADPAEATRPVTLRFERGVPCGIDGRDASFGEIVAELNRRYRLAPFAWDLVLENRFTGIKSRGLYVNPAARVLHEAVGTLARAALPEPAFRQWVAAGEAYADLLYRGEWFSSVRDSVLAGAEPLTRSLTGEITLAPSPGLHVAKLDVPHGLFTRERASFETEAADPTAANGYIALQWQRRNGGSDESAVESEERAESFLRGVAPLPR